MGFLIKIGIFVLNVIYFFFKFLPIKNKITFISRQSNKKSIDISLLEKEIKKQDNDIKLVFLCKKIDNKILYFFHMFKQMYHIATSKIVILDGYCIAISNLKHKQDLIVIQMWHALGSFKKFGYSILNQKEGTSVKMAHLMKMHKNYNYVIASGSGCIKPYSEAFNCDKSIIKIYPLPRVDLLLNKTFVDKKKNEILKQYPKLKSKRNILYAPTFRKNIDISNEVRELINSINYEKYNLIVKLHPLTKIKIDDQRVIFDREFDTIEMMMVSDYIISDYSSVIHEASILNKPIYFWSYDYDSYLKNRNFYLNYEKDLPGVIFTDINKLIKSIESEKVDYDKLKKFKDKYIKYTDNATRDLVVFILELFYKDNK